MLTLAVAADDRFCRLDVKDGSLLPPALSTTGVFDMMCDAM